MLAGSASLLTPPLYPDTAPFANGEFPKLPVIDPDNLHPHMLGILGIPITEQVLEIMRMVNNANESTYVQEPTQHDSKTKCPRCQGVGFTHESSAKHTAKQGEKCKHCKKCLGINRL